jgi:ubiquinone biosynthesis protein COQ4
MMTKGQPEMMPSSAPALVDTAAIPASILTSSSRYLNDVRLRAWTATICLRRNGPDLLPVPEIRQMVSLLAELQDHDRIEALFTAERRRNPRLDRWFDEGYYSPRSEVSDYRDYPPGSLGNALLNQFGQDYKPQISDDQWDKPRSQYEFYRRRQVQMHDLEHILTGGGIDALGELVPSYFRMANTPRFIVDQELAGELCIIHILGALRYTVRTMLHYPQVWTHCLDAIHRGIRAGTTSDWFFIQKLEPCLAMPLAEARHALGVRDVIDRDTAEASAFWLEQTDTPPAPITNGLAETAGLAA